MSSDSVFDKPGRSEEDRARRREERRRRLRERIFDSTVPSPCIAVCQMDQSNSHCIGCFRTIDEIRDWIIMTADEKRAVLARLEKDKP
jgi:predicted Fe-S protein YdhL (DUF1289 family)